MRIAIQKCHFFGTSAHAQKLFLINANKYEYLWQKVLAAKKIFRPYRGLNSNSARSYDFLKLALK